MAANQMIGMALLLAGIGDILFATLWLPHMKSRRGLPITSFPGRLSGLRWLFFSVGLVFVIAGTAQISGWIEIAPLAKRFR